MIKILKLNK